MSIISAANFLNISWTKFSASPVVFASDREAFERCGGMQQIGQLARYVLSLGEQFNGARSTRRAYG